MLYYIHLPQHAILIADQKIMKPVLQSRSRPCHSLHSSPFDWLILKASYKLVKSLDWFSKRISVQSCRSYFSFPVERPMVHNAHRSRIGISITQPLIDCTKVLVSYKLCPKIFSAVGSLNYATYPIYNTYRLLHEETNKYIS